MRYTNQNIIVNDKPDYRRFLKSRGMKSIRQYNTPTFQHPNVADLKNFKRHQHIWKPSDRYSNLASEFYNDPEKWWVIALYNQKPTEFHAKPGQIIYIPYPLESVLYYMGY